MREVAQTIMTDAVIDFLDLSLWDYAKEPNEPEFKGRTLMSYFTDLDRGNVRLGCAGKIMTPNDAWTCLEREMDFLLLGRAAVLHHDYPDRMRASISFRPVSTPVSADYLLNEGLSPPFVDYMRRWEGFVEPATATEPA